MKRNSWRRIIGAVACLVVALLMSGCASKDKTSTASKSSTSVKASSIKAKSHSKKAKTVSEKPKKLTAEEEARKKKKEAIFKGITLSITGTESRPMAGWNKQQLLTNIATYLSTQSGADPATVLKVINVKVTAQKIPNEKMTEMEPSFRELHFPDMFAKYYDSGVSLSGEQKGALDQVANDLDNLTVDSSAASKQDLGYSEDGYQVDLVVTDETGFGVTLEKNFDSMPKAQELNVKALLKDHLYVHMTGWENTEDTIKGVYIDQETSAKISSLIGTTVRPGDVNALWDVRREKLDFRAGDTVTVDFDSLAQKLADLTPDTASVTWYGDGQGPAKLKAE
ncbi:hypothetical protein [Lacticaseibacillus parakribbianus]|uniref:hypothetical protein n=1 Tax=Lacticaseibacillus parakribbianus TaxID=2970927 RepID=UPI0021CB125C|nr:hypothetical protein [Lacticaseibacillus parakribbianus]